MLGEERILKMRQSLGSASGLVDSDQYLPMFRNRQKNYCDEFTYSVELSKLKNNPSKYFASIWSPTNLRKTLDWLRKLINRAKSRAAAERLRQKICARLESEQRSINHDGLARLADMKQRILSARLN